MGNQLLNWALKQTDVKGPAKCVLIVLAIRAKECPSLTEIARDSGLARRTVIRSLEELEQIEKLRRERHQGNNTIYALVTSVRETPVTSVRETPVTSVPEALPTSATVTSVREAPVSERHQLDKRKESNQRKEKSPTTLHIPSSLDLAPERRPRQIAEDFSVSDNMREWAHQKGFDSQAIADETEAMIDHFRGSGKAKRDWVATWRNWLRNSRGRFNGNGKYRREANADITLRNARELAAQFGLQNRGSGQREPEQGNARHIHRTAEPALFGPDPEGDETDD